jgi:hypothetical protein
MLQQHYEFAHAVSEFLQKGALPANKRKVAYVAKIAPSCFLEDSILWRRIHRHNTPAQTVLVVPAASVDLLVHEAHNSPLAGMKVSQKQRSVFFNLTSGPTWTATSRDTFKPATSAKPNAKTSNLLQTY